MLGALFLYIKEKSAQDIYVQDIMDNKMITVQTLSFRPPEKRERKLKTKILYCPFSL